MKSQLVPTTTAYAIVFELDDIGDLFNGQDADPFSTREVKTLGEAGVERLQKRFMKHWPRQPHLKRVTLRLPPEAITPGLNDRTRAAIQRYCTAQIAAKQVERKVAIRMALRQLAIALLVLALDVAIVYWLTQATAELLPGFVRGVLAVLALFAGSIAFWDAIQALLFDWVPFVQDTATYRWISGLDVAIELKPDAPVIAETQ